MDDNTEAAIVKQLEAVWGDSLQGVILFGSQAKGNSRPFSDTDLGVLLKEKVSPKEIWDTAQDVAAMLKCDVDLIDLKTASTVLQKEIIAYGRWLSKPDTFACDLFEVHVMSFYQQLQFERSGIIEDIKKRITNDG
ncbi:hypothetical protein CI610_02281 [invertebrate metagenome]|uniref:Polymerase beta nucleotidyltransferase domain-containing protein n=1 Tax=invertebrate metagenome TaxID=1711999 RepID=A0A2H9T6C3_9ZZZZ